MKIQPRLGTCYYPEHWPASHWRQDAQRMAELGLTWVRVGEFAWSRFEPEPGIMDFGWMDEAVEILAEHKLKVIMCTPTATPPRWMVDKHPDMLAVDVSGKVRQFGSRRHYSFSHQGYREESVRIANLMGERYGSHPAVQAWQLDNEYSCHDTTRSYGSVDLLAFRHWLKNKYTDISALNKAWGAVFWSMEYASFEQIQLPNLTVTEASPSHWLDFYRFSSDQVVHYNKAQADALRRHTDASLIHNYMGRIVDFDHYRVGQDLDIASWDSYPLGFLIDRSGTDAQWQQRFERQGDPDLQAFHHDLYRAVGRGRWWIMEQQPGPVNWAPNNPAPLPGMVRLWTLEAVAHQAEAICYFRWRQAPFAQEQMHAGLLRPDSAPSAVYPEVAQTAADIKELGPISCAAAEVALVFDYESCWAWEAQPQGEEFDGFAIAFDFYRALRRLGITIDILPPTTDDLKSYKMVLIPGLFSWSESLMQQIKTHPGTMVLGPRSGSKTADFQIPAQLPPAIDDFDCRVAYVETFSAASVRPLKSGGHVQHWLEAIESSEQVIEQTLDGKPVAVQKAGLVYLAGWLDADALRRFLTELAAQAGVAVCLMPEGVRQRQTKSHRFVFNHNDHEVLFEGETLAPAEVRISDC